MPCVGLSWESLSGGLTAGLTGRALTGRKLRQQLFKLNGKQSEKFEVEDAAIEIHKNGELRVEQRGRKRSFGMHETIRADGKKQKRLYPKAGNGVIALSGVETAKLVSEYKVNQPPITFQKFVENVVPFSIK